MSQANEILPVSDRQKYERGDVLCKVEVDCRVAAQPLPGGYLATQGKQVVKIRKADLPVLHAMVEPNPEEIERARRLHQKALEDYVAKGMEGLNADPESTLQRRRKLEAEYAGSAEAFFVRDNGRSILPLVSVKLVEDDIPAPQDEASVDSQTMLARIVAAELAKVMAAQQQNQATSQQPKKQ